MEFEILYRDAHVIAIEKPSGIAVHRSRDIRDREVVLQSLAEQVGSYLYPVHRIDRAASGVLCFATSSAAARELQARLADPRSVKRYLAIVRGEPATLTVMDRPLTDGRGNTKTRRPARTLVRRLASFSRLSLVECTITTGRRHQIRRHLQHLGHQIVGDSTYGKGRINRFLREECGLPRLALHAARTELASAGPARLVISCPLAADLREFMERLPDSGGALEAAALAATLAPVAPGRSRAPSREGARIIERTFAMTEITPVELQSELASTDPPPLLDCRETSEVEIARIEGALHIPMAEIPGRLDDIRHAIAKNQQMVVYCHHGVRSDMVCRYLRDEGLEGVRNLVGGIDGWSEAVDPNVPRY